MKKFFLHPVVFWVSAALAYIVFMIALTAAICYYPITQQSQYMDSIAANSITSYLSGETPTILSSDHIMVYDTSGQCVMDINPDVPWSTSITSVGTEASIAAALKGQEHFSFAYDSELDDLIVSKSFPIIEDGTITGVLMVIRNLKNIPESVEGSAIVFTVLYWIIIILVAVMRHRKKRYAEFESNYVANVTHALKAPIASVRALTEALIDVVPTESDKQQPYFGKILRETNVQQHIVQEILDLSKIQNRHVDLTKSRINAYEAMKPCLDKYESYSELMDINFTVTDALKGLPDINFNANCLSEIMDILLENAIKYVEDGAIIIDASTNRKKVTFKVTNTKGAIPSGDLPHVFERFYVGKNNKTHLGSGLGLSIVHAVIDGLHEKVWVESSEEKGTTFFFTASI